MPASATQRRSSEKAVQRVHTCTEPGQTHPSPTPLSPRLAWTDHRHGVRLPGQEGLPRPMQLKATRMGPGDAPTPVPVARGIL